MPIISLKWALKCFNSQFVFPHNILTSVILFIQKSIFLFVNLTIIKEVYVLKMPWASNWFYSTACSAILFRITCCLLRLVVWVLVLVKVDKQIALIKSSASWRICIVLCKRTLKVFCCTGSSPASMAHFVWKCVRADWITVWYLILMSVFQLSYINCVSQKLAFFCGTLFLF